MGSLWSHAAGYEICKSVLCPPLEPRQHCQHSGMQFSLNMVLNQHSGILQRRVKKVRSGRSCACPKTKECETVEVDGVMIKRIIETRLRHR